ncbi:hypothetical protein F4776DRAFT_655332 [Hypoxylon sp. NC0597]|nr:hypothetical protein F4776DRAFT_655332 [Hypoxylon sp. NC0597]
MSQQPSDQAVNGTSHYTNLHLSAVSTLYPPTPRDIKHMCGGSPSHKTPQEQKRITRVYYAEPSYYGYNPTCYMIKETRYDIGNQWHPPSDELVADDAKTGSPVVAVGWWVESEDGLDFKKIWETRVYYIDKDGKIRERTNHSRYSDTTFKDDFDAELPEPAKLIFPTPGWKQTPLASGGGLDGIAFPTISPFLSSKLAAVRTETGDIYLFYQGTDSSIHALIFQQGTGWKQESAEVVHSDSAKTGTPLTAITGAYCEIRLFYVTPQDQLGEIYADDHTKWTERTYANLAAMPPHKLYNPTAMLSAVAWNYASAFFQIRVYLAGENNRPLSYSFSRKSGGWALDNQSESEFAFRGTRSGFPLSAVAAVIVENECNPRVYFHPQRIIAEWDVCKEIASFVAAKEGEKSRGRRKIEKETRERIHEEEKQNETKRKVVAKWQTVTKANLKSDQVLNIQVGDMVKIGVDLLERVKEVTKCPQGWEWKKEVDGWRCSGGQHFLTNAQFAAL